MWEVRGEIHRQKLQISKDFLQSCCLSCAGVVPEVVPSLMGFNQYAPSISSQTENDKVTAPCLRSPCWLTQGQSVDKLKESSSSDGIHPKLPPLRKWLQHLLHSSSPQVAGYGSEGAVTTRATLNVGYILMGTECMFFLRICRFNHACCCH